MTGWRIPERLRSRDAWLGLGLFLALIALYPLGPKRDLHDPRYALLASESVLRSGSLDLAPFIDRELEEGETPRQRRWVKRPRPEGERRGPYQLRRLDDGRLLYFFPPGTPLLSVPLVAAARPFGFSAVNANGYYTYRGEQRLQTLLAALLAALGAVIVFRLARRELPAGWSLAVAAVAALGTSIWSIAAQALWSHSWSVVLVGGAWLELLRWEDGERPRPLLLGALLSAAFWVRPTDALVAFAVTLVVALRHRRSLLRLIATGAVGLALFVALSWRVWGELLPPYFQPERTEELRSSGVLEALTGLLISPVRGLIAFSPVLLLIPFCLLLWGVPRRRRVPMWAATAVVVAHVALYAFWRHWWAGASFGPRILTDVVPLLAWLGALAVRSAREATSRRFSRVAIATLAVPLLAWGFLSHGAGAFSRGIVQRTSLSGGWTNPHLLWQWRRAPAVQLVESWLSAPEDTPRRRPRGRRRRPRARPPANGSTAAPAVDQM